MRARATRWARLLLLLALAGTQAYASTAQLVRLCTMAPERRAPCHCPPSHQEPGPSQDEDHPALHAADCCERQVIQAAVSLAVVDVSRGTQVAHPPVSVVVAPPPQVDTARGPLALRWTPSQGPPLFLKVRMLLI